MSEVVSVAPVDAGPPVGPAPPRAARSRIAQLAPTAMVASVLGWVLVPPSRSERGFTTVEYIFGIILAVAVISVFISVVTNDANQGLFKAVIAWALKLRDLLGFS